MNFGINIGNSFTKTLLIWKVNRIPATVLLFGVISSAILYFFINIYSIIPLIFTSGTAYPLWLFNKKEKIAIKKNKETLEEQALEIKRQNTSLVARQKEIAYQRKQLVNLNSVIQKQNSILKHNNSDIEDRILDRTTKLEKQNRELLNSNHQLEQFAYITTHNLRSPISQISALINLYDQNSDQHQPNIEVIDKINKSARNLNEVITDLNKVLSVNETNNINLETINLDNILEEITCLLTKNIEDSQATIISKFEDAPNIKGNRNYIRSILFNLVSNALKYKSKTRTPKIKITSLRKKGEQILQISDNGIGIDLEQFGDKIFGFYQRFNTEVEGKGLGLYIVKKQVEAMKGSIELNSKIDRGTKFKITIPL